MFEKPRLEVADIVRDHGESFLRAHVVTPAQHAVLRDIVRCRTAALGGHVDVCDDCGHSENSYNSCRNRHCPKCQGIAQARWLDQRLERILPTHYFHVVFTLPSELHPLVLANARTMFDMLMTCAGETLIELGRDRLGAQLGVTEVLHTWTRELLFHPHAHCIVTGGGVSLDGRRWISTRPTFLLPVRVLGALFRGKFLARLVEAYNARELRLEGPAAKLADNQAFACLRAKLYRKKWHVYSKPPFGGAEHVFKYLGRYTHRVGLSNHRLLSLDRRGVTFRTRGDATTTVTPDEFLRRFLLHVLPPRFVKIRHYGLMAASSVKKLAAVRELIGDETTTNGANDDDDDDVESFRTSCPRCGGTMTAHDLVGGAPLAALPPRWDTS